MYVLHLIFLFQGYYKVCLNIKLYCIKTFHVCFTKKFPSTFQAYYKICLNSYHKTGTHLTQL